MRVAFLSYWEPPAVTFERHRWMTPRRSGFWQGLEATDSLWRADYVVVHHRLPGKSYQWVPPWKTLLLRHEPSDIAPQWPPRSVWPLRVFPRAYVQSFASGAVPMVATWWINMDYDTLSALRPPAKPKALSCIVSAKTAAAGHRARLQLVRALAAAYPAAVDIYGRGLAPLELGAAYKGGLERDTGFPLGGQCKYDGLRDYRYSLCVENGRERNYYTEKIVDAWLSWSMPLYWGCPNLADYYPREAFIEVDIGAVDAAADIVRRAREPLSRLQMAAIAEARHLALERYGVWGTVRHLLTERGGVSGVPAIA